MGCDDLSDDDDEKLPFTPLPWSEADLKETKGTTLTFNYYPLKSSIFSSY